VVLWWWWCSDGVDVVVWWLSGVEGIQEISFGTRIRLVLISTNNHARVYC